MEVNVGQQRIVELRASYSSLEVREMALARRTSAFGRITRFIQRIRPDEVEITVFQKRFEPFWFGAASARYAYDRRRTFNIQVAPEVKAVTLYGNRHNVVYKRERTVEFQGVEHCLEEPRRDLALNATTGDEANALRKYLAFPQREAPDIAALEQDGALVVQPEVRGSFVVRKLVADLTKTLQADDVHEEKIDVEQVTLFYRPVYAVEYFWKTKRKKKVVEFDALTGAAQGKGAQIKQQISRVLENDELFDVGAQMAGKFVPGGNIAVKLGRFAARRAMR